MARPDLEQARMDYERVTRALAFLEENWRARPSLDEAAAAAGAAAAASAMAGTRARST